MNIIRINDSNLDLLQEFINKIGTASKSFRYFNSRTLDVIQNHLITLMIVDNNKPIAYGHLDVESKTVWLGVCVLPDFQGMGYANILLNELILFAKQSNVYEIHLTVDNENTKAINLYKKCNFIKKIEFEKYSEYSLIL